MIPLIASILLVLAFALTLLRGLMVPPATRPHLGWVGVACALLAWLLTHWPGK